MQRFGRVLRLRPGAEDNYERHHREIWPEVLQAIRQSGICHYAIFRYSSWLFSYFELPDSLSMEDASRAFERSEACARWEALMHTLQEPLPESGSNNWWVPMNEVWNLDQGKSNDEDL